MGRSVLRQGKRALATMLPCGAPVRAWQWCGSQKVLEASRACEARASQPGSEGSAIGRPHSTSHLERSTVSYGLPRRRSSC